MKTVRLEFSINSFYVGSVNDEYIPNGMGHLQYDENETYYGEFKNGLRNGKGKYTYKNGNCYNGEWQDDKKNGKGRFENKKQKYIYIGEWEDDEICGKGQFKQINEIIKEDFLLDENKQIEYSNESTEDEKTNECSLFKTPTKKSPIDMMSTDAKSNKDETKILLSYSS